MQPVISRCACLLFWQLITLLLLLAVVGGVQARAADNTGGDGNGTTLQSPTAAAPDPIHHYLQFLNAEVGFRYVYQDLNAGQVVERDLSYRLTTTMKLNLTPSGATYVQMRSENGPGFNSGFQSTGLGSPGSFSMNVKSLFVGQRFGSHVEAQAGGIEFDRGSGTDATYAAGEAWLTGYRLAVDKLNIFDTENDPPDVAECD